MDTLKAVGSGLLGIVGFCAVILLVVSFIYNATWVSAWAIPYMAWATNVAMAISLLLLLPLSLFRRTKAFAAHGSLISSFVFGLCLWMAYSSQWGYGA
jgi:hypothetical protein